MFIYAHTLYNLSFTKCVKHYYIFNQSSTLSGHVNVIICLNFRLPSPVSNGISHHYMSHS